MATFVAGDVGKFKELRISGVTRKALITAVNAGSSLVSYIPQKMTTDPNEVVPAAVSNAAWATVDTQADWPPVGSGAGRGGDWSGNYPSRSRR